MDFDREIIWKIEQLGEKLGLGMSDDNQGIDISSILNNININSLLETLFEGINELDGDILMNLSYNDKINYMFLEFMQRRGKKIDYSDINCTDTYKLYQIMLSKIPVLLDEEEHYLIELKESGNKIAFNALIKYNLKFVVNHLNTNNKLYGNNIMDIIQVGNQALQRCVEKSLSAKNTKICTYAGQRIIADVNRYLKDTSRDIRVPICEQPLLKSIKYTIIRLEKKLGRYPYIQEIAEEVNIDIVKLQELMIYLDDSISLDIQVGEDGSDGRALGDTIPSEGVFVDPEESSLEGDLRSRIIKILESELSSKEKMIILARDYCIEPTMTFEELATLLGVTNAAVRQKRKTILRHLAESEKMKALVS